jgi:ribosome-binding ATPase YchF (GTP1/OBG family)
MKKGYRIIVLGCLLVSVLSIAAWAQDIQALSEEFYSGLANIIEHNMDKPDECVRFVENYYQANRDKVQALRKAAEEAMAKIAPQIDKYMNMTEEEARAMEQQQGLGQDRGRPKLSGAAQRYTTALQEFSAKYPKYGMEIAVKAMQIVPGFEKQGE